MTNEIREYDTNGKLIHFRNSDGYEEWYEYAANGNLIHYRNSTGYEEWREYDDNGNMIHPELPMGTSRGVSMIPTET